jgi:colanic acid/amylovoran biosynthesis glycosyltransferase
MFNVAHFISPYLKGTETFVYNYIKAFARCNSFIFTYKVENLDQFQVDNLIKTTPYSVPWVLYVIAAKLSFPGRIVDKLLFDRNNTQSIRSRLRQHSIGLIHSHFGHMGCYSINLKKVAGLPMVTTFYGWDMSFLPLVGWGRRYIPLFSAGECFLVEGSHMKSCLAKLGCPDGKIRIVHIGVDVRRFQYRERTGEHGGRVVFLFCGRLIEKKGLEYAIKALALVKDRYRNIQFRVIGDGPLKGDIIKLINVLKLNDMVKLLGYRSYGEVKREMDGADILVQPSVTARNGETEGGAPAILLEAQACGMPILASCHADIPEVVLDGKSGFLSEERDFEQLAEHMKFLLEHPEKWAEMGLVGRKHMKINYDIISEAKKIEKIYASLIG